MAFIDTVAKELKMNPNELLNVSLKSYLYSRLSKVETDLFVLTKKYGVKDVFELDSKVKKGLISEKDSYDDYFTLDNLEADRDKIKRLLGEL